MLTFYYYLSIANALINSHALLRKLNTKQIKLQQKPWIIRGMQNSTHKNRFFKKYIRSININEAK